MTDQAQVVSFADARDARIAALEAKIAAMKASQQKALRFKVSEKGAVSIYGMGKFPITMYRSQLERVLDAKDDLLAFVKDNVELLATKD